MGDVLVLQAARFGDLLQSRRLIKSLQASHTVNLCIDHSLVPLAELLYPKVIIHGLYFHAKVESETVSSNIKTISQLKESQFTRIYNCNFSPLTASLCRIFESDKVVAYRAAHDSLGGIDRSPWARFAFRLTQKRSISSLNLEDFWAYFAELPIAPDLVNPMPKSGGKGIGIACAGREPRRSLSIKTLSDIIKILNRVYAHPHFYLFGTSQEEAVAKKIIHALASEKIAIHNLVGRTNWQQLAENFSGLDLLISPDTGLMHLAAFLGVPVMAFFMSSAWAWETGPYGMGHIIWQSVENCSPCLENIQCANSEKCRLIFESPDFIRLFSQFLLNPNKELSYPDNLQVLRSSFDNVGQTLSLVKGKDLWAEGRSTARTFMKSFLKKDNSSFIDSNNDWLEICAKLLCPDENWMLPPGRYC